MLLRDMAMHLLFEFNLSLYGGCAMTDRLLIDRELLEELRDAANESMNATTRQHQIDHFAGLIAKADAILSAPSPAGVDGPVRNFKTREGYDVWDKLCAIPKFGFLIGPSGGVVKVADIGNWIDRDEAQSVVDEAQCEVNLLRHEASAAQAIIDGLRGEVADLQSMLATVSKAGLRVRTERDAALVECERRQMQLAACGVVALANTIESAGEARQMHPDYMSASCSDVAGAVDREIALRTERDQQAQRIGELEGLLRHAQKQVPTGSGLHMRIDALLSAGKEGE